MKDKATQLIALAERCEQASEYDGRLMAEIDCALRYSDLRPAEPDDHPTVTGRGFDPSSIWTPTGWLMSHSYWRSIDDAAGLVPPGHTWTVYADGCAGVVPKLDEDDLADGDVWAATPALALTAAALRAHASLLEKEPQA